MDWRYHQKWIILTSRWIWREYANVKLSKIYCSVRREYTKISQTHARVLRCKTDTTMSINYFILTSTFWLQFLLRIWKWYSRYFVGRPHPLKISRIQYGSKMHDFQVGKIFWFAVGSFTIEFSHRERVKMTLNILALISDLPTPTNGHKRQKLIVK